jgi:hypothetical protein
MLRTIRFGISLIFDSHFPCCSGALEPRTATVKGSDATPAPFVNRRPGEGGGSHLFIFGLLNQMMTAVSGEGHHGERRVLIARRRECVPPKHIEIRDVMRLAKTNSAHHPWDRRSCGLFRLRGSTRPNQAVRSSRVMWAFLDSAVERLFLRKVGGSYIFIHRMLMEYFASMAPHQIGMH